MKRKRSRPTKTSAAGTTRWNWISRVEWNEGKTTLKEIEKNGEISKHDVKYLPPESESLNSEQEKHKQAAGPAEPAGGWVLLNS